MTIKRHTCREKYYLVLDSHPTHIANSVKEYVQGARDKLELHFYHLTRRILIWMSLP